ncbi:hypothetical protein ACQKLP_20845 [Chitinophaga sp. NPDC101104]|uniref:hypothetical protein n=1 Tax=Chitinophaga sp. NPDC101104 TaxID=3390561 RepID=UPI003D026284
MRYDFYALLLLCLATIMTSCSKGKSNMEFKSEYDRSYDAWAGFKSKSGNKYQYTVNQSSVFNFGANTTITVVGGKVTERKFSSYKREGTGQIVITGEWTEDANAIGSHTAGAAAITMDEVYAKAKNDWLKKRENVKVYFESKNNGMLSTAGYVPNGCMDDCFEGIYITSIIQY